MRNRSGLALAPLLFAFPLLGCAGTVDGGAGGNGGGGSAGNRDSGPGADSGSGGAGGGGGDTGGAGGAGGTDGGGSAGAGGGAGMDGGPDAPPPSGKEPNCAALGYKEIVSVGSVGPIPVTADDMFCYTNAERHRYQIHGRNSGCGWSGMKAGSGMSWPYKMKWSAELTVKAQKEAERVAAGGSPKGGRQCNAIPCPGPCDNGAAPIWLSGCASGEYTVTDPADRFTYWEEKEDCDTYAAGLSSSSGTARMSVHYYDPGAGNPVLTHLGVGLSPKGKDQVWVLVFGP